MLNTETLLHLAAVLAVLCGGFLAGRGRVKRKARLAVEEERSRTIRHIGACTKEFQGVSRPLSLVLSRLMDRIMSGEEPPK